MLDAMETLMQNEKPAIDDRGGCVGRLEPRSGGAIDLNAQQFPKN